MLETNQNQFFEAALFQSTGLELQVEAVHFVSGGCINNAVQLETKEGPFFLKWNRTQSVEFFEVEAEGLKTLEFTGCVSTPTVIGTGEANGFSYLLLEFIESYYPLKNYWETLGRQLAQLHQCTQPQYGLEFDNYIGALPQKNELADDWLSFFVENRLRVQFGLALYNQLIDQSYLKKLDLLSEKLVGVFPKEAPSLIHGDLWSGNVMSNKQGLPTLIDPAVYFGHREMELAFTELFGGFDNRFYDAYKEVLPLEGGYEERKAIYNLYPLMVHVNLFGKSYLSGIDRTMSLWLD